MNVHTFLDLYTVKLSSLLTGKNKYFSQSIASPTMPELLETIHMQLPDISGIGVYEVEAETAIGQLDPAFYVAQWLGEGYPTLIYHHGNNERPFDFSMFSKNTFKTIILDQKEQFNANLIVVRAPFHQSLKEYMKKVTDLQQFTTMLATSVKLIDLLEATCRAQGSPQIVISGISLGGWITNMHRTYYNSADLYLPMMAGAALDEVFISSAYRQLTGDLALTNAEQVREVLNFESEFSAVTTDNIYPLLARHDRFIIYARQKQGYGNLPITVIDKGHVTGAISAKTLREFLLMRLTQVSTENFITADPILNQPGHR